MRHSCLFSCLKSLTVSKINFWGEQKGGFVKGQFWRMYPRSGFSGPKKPWEPQTWQDLTRFSPLDFSLLSPDFVGLVLLNCTENLEKKQKIQWRASSGDGAPKLQISVPCRGRTCPEFLGVREYQKSWLSSARAVLQGKTFWMKFRCRGTSAKTTLFLGNHPLGNHLSGTESAILNRESGDSESCDSNRAIPRSL